MTVVLALAEGKQPWFWGFADVVALSLLLLNVLMLLAVHLRRLRQYTRTRHEKRFRAHVEEVLAQLDPRATTRDPEWLDEQLRSFDSSERPIAAVMLIERLRPATDAEREHTLDALRELGAIDRIVAAPRARMPWRRALAIRTLGWVGADEAVPVLIDRLSDRNRYVRESAVRALGRIGDEQALPVLAGLFCSPGSVGTGVVYDALIGFGRSAEPIFAEALASTREAVRIAACFGVAALDEPDAARRLLEPMLDDASAPVRSAAAASLGQVGGGLPLPEGLARAAQDDEVAVRAAAIGALGSFDDPHAVELALNALDEPDRDTAVRAGEALVRLSRGHNAGAAATAALQQSAEAWPVERALIFASLGVV